jgi:hypothetical protein
LVKYLNRQILSEYFLHMHRLSPKMAIIDISQKSCDLGSLHTIFIWVKKHKFSSLHTASRKRISEYSIFKFLFSKNNFWSPKSRGKSLYLSVKRM